MQFPFMDKRPSAPAGDWSDDPGNAHSNYTEAETLSSDMPIKNLQK
jgi:hypothetical protein